MKELIVIILCIIILEVLYSILKGESFLKELIAIILFFSVLYGGYYVLIEKPDQKRRQELETYFAVNGKAYEISKEFVDKFSMTEENKLDSKRIKETKEGIQYALQEIVEYQLEFEGDKQRDYKFIGSFSNYDHVFEVTCENKKKVYATRRVDSYLNSFDVYVQDGEDLKLCKEGLGGNVDYSENSERENKTQGVNHVAPHDVSGYQKSDGTYVEGYHRGGDTGYYRSNPDEDRSNNFKK